MLTKRLPSLTLRFKTIKVEKNILVLCIRSLFSEQYYVIDNRIIS